MKKKIVVLQEDKKDCAAACIKSIIKHYNGNLDLETIRNIINTNIHGTNAYDIVNGVKEIGLNAYGKKVSFTQIEKHKDLFPAIAHVKKGNMYHFVVLYNIFPKEKKLLIMDPSIGLIKVDYEKFENDYLETLLFFTKEKELPNVKSTNILLKVIVKTLLKDKKSLILLSILSFIVFSFSIVDSYYYKILLDNNIKDINLFKKYLFIFTTFLIFKNVFVYIREKLSIRVNYNIENIINKKTIKNIFCLPYSYYKNRTTGEITSRINDLESLKDLLLTLILNTFVDLFLISISFIIIFAINAKITIISIIILTLYTFIVKISSKRIMNEIKTLQELKGIYNNELIENINGIESINNLNIKDIRRNKLESSYINVSKTKRKINNISNTESLFKNITYDIGIIFIISLLFLNVLKNKITFGDLLLTYMIISFFLEIIKSILDSHINITYTLKNVEKINSIFNNTKEEKLTNKKMKGEIIIKNLNFKYGETEILKNKNLKIKEKDKIIITGKSGSGKSTLLNILLKKLENYEGSITINGINLKDIENSIINNSFININQKEVLFTDTLKNNILLDRKINEKDYKKVLKICKIEEILEKRKFKEDFLIEEGGFNISGGEKQRIILARALLKNAEYILIDEALSEVDTNLEREIIKSILENYKDKTIIYISHKEEIKELFESIYNLERSCYEH